MTEEARGPARRIGWGLLDQVVSSATNFLVGLVVARSVDLTDLGAFSLAFFTYTMVISICRSFPMEPLAIRYSTSLPDVWRRGTAAAVGTALGAALLAGLVIVGVGVIVGGILGNCLVIFGLWMPGLELQDAWRYAFFAAARGRDALLNDAAWGVLLIFGLAVLQYAGMMSVAGASLVFGATASVAALLGVLQSGVRPAPTRARWWWREQRDLAGRFLAEASVRNVTGQVALYSIGLVAGLGAVGALRAGQLVLAPVQVVYYGLSLVAVPEAVRALRQSRRRLVESGLVASAGLALLSLCWGVGAILVPDSIGQLALKQNWAAGHALLLPLMVGLIGNVSLIGAAMGLRALAAARHSLRAGLIGSAAGVVAPILGAVVDGSFGAACGLALAAIIGFVAWWWQFFVAMSDPAHRPVA